MRQQRTRQRKHYRDKLPYERVLDHLDRADRLRIQRDAKHREVYIAWWKDYCRRFSAPNRSCPGWMKELQGLTPEKLAKRVNSMICNGLQTKRTH